MPYRVFRSGHQEAPEVDLGSGFFFFFCCFLFFVCLSQKGFLSDDILLVHTSTCKPMVYTVEPGNTCAIWIKCYKENLPGLTVVRRPPRFYPMATCTTPVPPWLQRSRSISHNLQPMRLKHDASHFFQVSFKHRTRRTHKVLRSFQMVFSHNL